MDTVEPLIAFRATSTVKSHYPVESCNAPSVIAFRFHANCILPFEPP
jgi:hypothetical protein